MVGNKINIASSPIQALFVAAILLLVNPVCVEAQALPVSADINANINADNNELSSVKPTAEQKSDDILDLDLEQLGKVDAVVPAFDVAVTSVTKSPSTIGKSPAAISVITQDMIRRSGATSIPEVLRMVPGMQVAQIESNKWAVSARGFNDRFANKLLVLVDGVSVYNALFSGVYWESQDVVLEDIDRIEIIRGPGATLWGANAVNGVVNIITKDSSKTKGVLVASGGGSHDSSMNTVRVGGQLANGVTYRVFGKQFERNRGFSPSGAHDDWRMNRIGMRFDGNFDNETDSFTLLGNLYDGSAGESGSLAQPGFPFEQQYVQDNELAGGHILGRVTRQHSDENVSTIQFYYDKTVRDESIASARFDVFDLEFSQRFRLASNQMINWGLGYRRHQDFIPTTDPFIFSLTPVGRKLNRTSAFIQDEIAIRDNLTGFIGSKISHNDFTGFEFQPSARLLWSISERNVAWVAVSRAVRTPSRINDIRLVTFGSPFFNEINGNPDPESENLAAYEVGFRRQRDEKFSWDVNLFFNHYTDLQEQVIAGLTPGFPPTVNVGLENNGQAKTMGLEYSANYQLAKDWKLNGWYSFLANSDVLGSPKHQAFVASSWDLPKYWELDLLTRYTDTLPAHDIDSYIDVDVRLGWRPNDRFEASLVGQNLLDSSRPEFVGPATGSQPTEVRRGVFAQVVWRY